MSIDSLLQATRHYFDARSESEVRESFDSFNWQLPSRDSPPQSIPACACLTDVIEHCALNERELVSAFLRCQPLLRWGRSYTSEDFGEYFYNHYGYMELVGTRGHYQSNDLAIGFVLFGPNVTYPNHWHLAEELYFPLTGGGMWSRDNQAAIERQSGEFIFHPSNMAHAMSTQDKPLLALYVWRSPKGSKADLAQKCDF